MISGSRKASGICLCLATVMVMFRQCSSEVCGFVVPVTETVHHKAEANTDEFHVGSL
jgi:hypothetical protein